MVHTSTWQGRRTEPGQSAERARGLRTEGPAKWEVLLQWVPTHCGLTGNERADRIAKRAAELYQSTVPIEPRAITHAAAKLARRNWRMSWPDGLYREIYGNNALPGPISSTSREFAVDVHQLRAGHWSGSTQYMHRIGSHPTDTCPG